MTDSKTQVRDISKSEQAKKLELTKTFNIDHPGEDGERKLGEFTIHRATIGDLMRYGVIKARLCGGENVDTGCAWMAEMVALCRVCIDDAPKWWKPEDSFDEGLLAAVYDQVREFQNSFRDRSVPELRTAPSDGST
jgi:hypothetical protein